jgi:Outer membrane protein
MRSQFLFFVTIICYSVKGFTQSPQNDSLPNATLPACIQYALIHQPHIQQSLLDEKIAKATIRTKLGDWFPQISLDAYYQHNIKLPTNFFNGAYIANGTSNISSIGVSAHKIFSTPMFCLRPGPPEILKKHIAK